MVLSLQDRLIGLLWKSIYSPVSASNCYSVLCFFRAQSLALLPQWSFPCPNGIAQSLQKMLCPKRQPLLSGTMDNLAERSEWPRGDGSNGGVTQERVPKRCSGTRVFVAMAQRYARRCRAPIFHRASKDLIQYGLHSPLSALEQIFCCNLLQIEQIE